MHEKNPLKTKRLGGIKYTESSGNVFADLGLANPEEALAKAQLAWEIAKIIKKRKLAQKGTPCYPDQCDQGLRPLL